MGFESRILVLLVITCLSAVVVINAREIQDHWDLFNPGYYDILKTTKQWWTTTTTKLTTTTPRINNASDTGICNGTCFMKIPENGCSISAGTCPMNKCILQRNSHCDYNCDGTMCNGECNSNTTCHVQCTGIQCDTKCSADDCEAECYGIGCIAECEGKRCLAKCTGLDCSAKCKGENCTTSEFTCHGYQCKGTRERKDGLFKHKCDGWWCQARCHSSPEPCNITCNGQNCESKCVGPDCVAECFGKMCSTECRGLHCNSSCLDSPCEADCYGDNCFSETRPRAPLKAIHFHQRSQARCYGENCLSQCTAQFCKAMCNGTNCNAMCLGVFCDQEYFCDDGSCANATRARVRAGATERHQLQLPNTGGVGRYRVKLVN